MITGAGRHRRGEGRPVRHRRAVGRAGAAPCARLPRAGFAAQLREAVIALNHDRIGHRYGTYHYEVSREKIREYALATGVRDPVYAADPAEVPAEEVLAPPTFATCLTAGRGELFEDPELGAHWNLVHGSQQYDFSRPLRAGDLLACTPDIVDIVDRGRMELLIYRVRCEDARTGEHVVTCTSVIIFFEGEEA